MSVRTAANIASCGLAAKNRSIDRVTEDTELPFATTSGQGPVAAVRDVVGILEDSAGLEAATDDLPISGIALCEIGLLAEGVANRRAERRQLNLS